MKSVHLNVGESLRLGYQPLNTAGTPITPKPSLSIRHLAATGHPDVAQAAVINPDEVQVTGIAPGHVIIFFGFQHTEADAAGKPVVVQCAVGVSILVESHVECMGLQPILAEPPVEQQQQQQQQQQPPQ